MKVHELIAKLSALDQNLEVIGWCEDEDVASDDRMFKLFHITSVESVHGERTRLHGVPYMMIGSGSSSAAHAVLDITADY